MYSITNHPSLLNEPTPSIIYKKATPNKYTTHSNKRINTAPKDDSELTEFTRQCCIFSSSYFLSAFVSEPPEENFFSFLLLFCLFILLLPLLCLTLVLAQEKRVLFCKQSYFRWTYFNLLHTYFLDLLFMADFFSLRVPPSQACTHRGQTQGSVYSGYFTLGERSHSDRRLDSNRHSGNRYRGDRSVGSSTPDDCYNPSDRYHDDCSSYHHYFSDHSFNDQLLGDCDNISCGFRSTDDLFPALSIACHSGGYTDHKRNCG